MTRSETWARWYDKAKQDPAWIARRREQKAASHQRRRDHNIARSLRWAEANRERVREIYRAFYLRHIEAERARERRKPRDVRRAAFRRWRIKPESKIKLRAKENKRRARMRQSEIGPVDYAAVIAAANGICGICREPVGDELMHVDHIIPLARGGSHTQNNLQLAHARCNLSKGASLLKAG